MTTQVKYQDRTVTANGLKIHYLEWGDPSAPALVALHGLRGHGHTWDSFSEPLSSQYHIFALDQRGRGETDWAPDGQYTGMPSSPTSKASWMPWDWTTSFSWDTPWAGATACSTLGSTRRRCES